MKRRSFLKLTLSILGSISFVSFAYPLVRFLGPMGSTGAGKKVVLWKHEIPVGTSKIIDFDEKLAIVINRPDKGFIALSKVCTHLGCLVEYEKDTNTLLCPCHAGRFDLEGNVLSGPPPRSLSKYPLKVEGDQIIIG